MRSPKYSSRSRAEETMPTVVQRFLAQLTDLKRMYASSGAVKMNVASDVGKEGRSITRER